MSRNGDTYDNAVAENIFNCLKRGLIHLKHHPTGASTQTDIFAYLEALTTQYGLALHYDGNLLHSLRLPFGRLTQHEQSTFLEFKEFSRLFRCFQVRFSGKGSLVHHLLSGQSWRRA